MQCKYVSYASKSFPSFLKNLEQKNNSKPIIQKTAEATGDLLCNNKANRMTKVSKNSQRNNLEN